MDVQRLTVLDPAQIEIEARVAPKAWSASTSTQSTCHSRSLWTQDDKT